MDTNTPATIPAVLSATVKPWWRSRTIQFNCVIAVLGAVEALAGPLQQIVGPAAFPGLLMTVAMINAVLRVVTAQGIGR